MSKFAVRGLVQSLGMFSPYALKIPAFDVRCHRGCRDLIAQELRDHGICVNGYAPGTIQTDLGMRGCGLSWLSVVMFAHSTSFVAIEAEKFAGDKTVQEVNAHISFLDSGLTNRR